MFVVLSVLQLCLGLTSGHSMAAESSLKSMNALQLEEFRSMSVEVRFPAQRILKKDPLTKQPVDGIWVGPSFKAKFGDGHDYYRYLTFYKTSERRERIYDLPIQREECYEKSELNTSNTVTTAYTATINASVAWEGLGVSATIAKAQTFTTSHNGMATGDLVADITPTKIIEDQEGSTFIQTYNTQTHKVELITQKTDDSAWWMALFFPTISQKKYPMDFEVKNAGWTFDLVRKIYSFCSAQAEKAWRDQDEYSKTHKFDQDSSQYFDI
jgi:hypothetical protein